MDNTIIANYLSRHELVLQDVVQQADIPAERVREAIHYTLFPGGKRLRPMLVYLCGTLCNAPLKSLDTIAASLELTHCYSLIHDDLPSMDNDDFRRGKLSCHRAFDEATAILVGDGMQALAIDLLLRHLPLSLSIPQVVAVTHELVKASGPSGMVSGQSLDLTELLNPAIRETELCRIHQLKTGKLFSACINMVIAAGSPNASETSALQTFAGCLGEVFQMQDDYLDRYGSTESLGKGRASDTANQKATYATLYTQSELFEKIHAHFHNAKQLLTIFGSRANDLLSLVNSIEQRSEYTHST